VQRVAAGFLVAVALAAAGAAPIAGQDRGLTPLAGLSVTNGGAQFAGDRPWLTTITPNGDGLRDSAEIHFRLREAARVRLAISRTRVRPEAVYARTYRLGPGPHTLTWTPSPEREARTYLVRLFVKGVDGATSNYGRAVAHRGRDAPVIRLLGIDAGFLEPSYPAGADAQLRIATDAPSLEVHFVRSGPEFGATRSSDIMHGERVSQPLDVVWHWTNRPHILAIRLPDIPSGFYYAKLTAPDGRIGYAPFIIRPVPLGSVARVAVVLPTNTWQAYNFYDADGNGWGDTWYAGPQAHPAVLRIGLQRPYLNRGVPPYFRTYDLGFLHWLAWSGREVEYVADPDLARLRTGERLRRAYDLVIFPGHEEYVTGRVYRIVRSFRDLGGSLAFLSADNFYWRVAARSHTLRRTRPWRELGRPEAELVGVQYRGNDGGRHQAPYTVERAGMAPWLFAGTDLHNGSRFGHFGIEVDGRARSSPRGTVVLAQIPHIFGRSVTAQMTYYETRRGAKVFAFGAFTLGGSATQPLQHTLLDNLWARLAPPG